MKWFYMLSFLTVACIFFMVKTHAQIVESDERALVAVEDGVSFSKDTLFLVNFRFRMQNRAGINTYGGDDFGVNEFEMRVRRLRLRLDGYVLHPRLQYYIQLAFSKADLDLVSGTIAQPLRDAIIYYTVNDNLYFGFGQSKLPGNRQRVLSSGSLQFADRSVANGIFNIDRDFGFFGYYTKKLGIRDYFILKGALTSGEGRNATVSGKGLAYTGRVEYLPFGLFANNGDYSEGDLEFEEKPKLSIGITYSINPNATRTGGQIGSDLFESRNLESLFIDAMFKYKGNAILAEYMSRSALDPITSNELNEIQFVQVGHGINLQISRMLMKKSEIAVRYSFVNPNQSISNFQDKVDELLVGYTYYLKGHRIKLQGNIGYKWLEGLETIENTGNSWTGMFQMEFGI